MSAASHNPGGLVPWGGHNLAGMSALRAVLMSQGDRGGKGLGAWSAYVALRAARANT